MDGIAVNSLGFRHDHCPGELGQNDLSILVRSVQALAGQSASLGIHIGAVGVGDFKFHAFQRLAGNGIQLVDDQAALGLIAELQSDCLTSLDFRSLGGIVQKVPILCDGFLDDQGRTRVDPFNQDGALRVSGEIAVAITNNSAIALRDKELHIGQGLVGLAVDFLDEQAALRTVAEIQLYNILVLTADVGGLGCGVDDMSAVTGQFLYNVSAGL